jgi:hypothetical protein
LKRTRTERDPAKNQVQRIPPSAEAAHDEGPRLIPLDEPSKEPSRLERYLHLADILLGRKRGAKAK